MTHVDIKQIQRVLIDEFCSSRWKKTMFSFYVSPVFVLKIFLSSTNYVCLANDNWWGSNTRNEPMETYSRNWIWPRSISVIGSVWWWNWYVSFLCAHMNLNNGISWGIISICTLFTKTWHRFGERYSFWPLALTMECAVHFRLCKKRH